MRMKFIFLSSLLTFAVLLLAACGGTNAAPTSNGNSSQNSSPVVSNGTGGTSSSKPASQVQQAAAANSNSTAGLKPQTVEGGNVTVKITPVAVKPGEPLEFDVAMDTHSVDLADDMLKSVVLRDDSGMEYAPISWEGPGAGGHHREGKLKFAPLTMNTQVLTLVVKNIAGVPERVYKWDAAQ